MKNFIIYSIVVSVFVDPALYNINKLSKSKYYVFYSNYNNYNFNKPIRKYIYNIFYTLHTSLIMTADIEETYLNFYIFKWK